jgi:hypothetical protein
LDASSRVRLRIVAADRVLPHETADPTREHRIEERLRADGVLRDPVIVGAVPDLDSLVLLDGTNRKRALAALSLPWIMVQVLDYADQHAVQLRTWCHQTDVPLDSILEVARALPGITVSCLPPLATSEMLENPGTLAVLLDRTHRWGLIREPIQETSRAEQLRVLVDVYEHRMARVDCDPESVEEQAHTHAIADTGKSTLVAFPRFSRSQVVSTAMSGELIPAGITRHVIPEGRALRVNLPLTVLAGSGSVEAANEALQQHLKSLQPRLYREPTILFDS